MILSQKQKTFSQSFSAFLKSTLTFDNSENKDDPHSFCISEITDSENVVRYMFKKSHFRKPFGKLHGELSEALLKSASQHLDNIHWSVRS